MGHPRKLRKKFSKPSHPWQKQRIDDEKVLMKEYGFKNKQELWKIISLLSKYKARAKDLVPRRDEESLKLKKDLMIKLQKFDLIKENAILEDVLALTFKNMCDRRLQTIVMKKGLARSIKQARQLITHGHIVIGQKKITAPSYLVSSAEAPLVNYYAGSSFALDTHPERMPLPSAENQKKSEVSEEGGSA